MYKSVLAAIDLTEDTAEPVLQRARAFVAPGGTLSAIHVVEPQYVQYSFDPTFKSTLSRSLEQDAVDLAAARLAELCEPHGIDAAHRYVMIGRAADHIHDVARERNFDLVVIGSHGQEGLRWLLGSTANAVLHGSPVDVVTVRIPRSASE
ncbi:MAG: universal stress protein [Pseudomonadales bacterium]